MGLGVRIKVGPRIGTELGRGVGRVLGEIVRILDGLARLILDGELVAAVFGVPPKISGDGVKVGDLVGDLTVGTVVLG